MAKKSPVKVTHTHTHKPDKFQLIDRIKQCKYIPCMVLKVVDSCGQQKTVNLTLFWKSDGCNILRQGHNLHWISNCLGFWFLRGVEKILCSSVRLVGERASTTTLKWSQNDSLIQIDYPDRGCWCNIYWQKWGAGGQAVTWFATALVRTRRRPEKRGRLQNCGSHRTATRCSLDGAGAPTDARRLYDQNKPPNAT